jgi:AcrR family transcriptional regulator
MTRLAENRDTHLSREEVAAEALRQFTEEGREPSMRSLAEALRTAPSTIYHHFSSREEIFADAVDLVWQEATAETLRLAPAPLEEPPSDVLVAVGVATRRTWLAHHLLAPHMAASPAPTEFTRNALELMKNLFGRLELDPEVLDSAFHAYSSFMIGAVLFAAARKGADQRLERSVEWEQGSLGEISGISATDPERDEQLFASGLERLIAGFELRV